MQFRSPHTASVIKSRSKTGAVVNRTYYLCLLIYTLYYYTKTDVHQRMQLTSHNNSPCSHSHRMSYFKSHTFKFPSRTNRVTGKSCLQPCPGHKCYQTHKLFNLTLYQPMTYICVMSSHKPIRIYMGRLILDINTLYRLFCFFKLFPMKQLMFLKEAEEHTQSI